MLNESRRTNSMPGFASPQVMVPHAVSLPQLTIRSEDQAVPLSRDRRQASLLKVNLDKQNSKDGKFSPVRAMSHLTTHSHLKWPVSP